ncbi:OsmC family protein [Ignavibacteria bacterium]|nr:OsmC family protein [Bacteroidota bacterium]MCZ2131924.1 OsmC family protein [Bacteroidota bacterium]
MATEITVSLGETPYLTTADNGRHIFYIDEPLSAGGGDTAPDPMEMLLASLGSCSLITMKMYATRKEWLIRSMKMKLSISTERTADGQRSVIHRHIIIDGDLDEQQRERIVHISKQCPVARVLSGNVNIETEIEPAN